MEKFVEEKYIEEHILRKKAIFDFLIYNQKGTIKQISNLLNTTHTTIYKEINQITSLSNQAVELKQGTIYLHITQEKEIRNFYRKLYKESDFLSLLFFYLTNTNEKVIETSQFPISRSKFYTVKTKIKKFCKINDLELKNKRIIGSYLKINWIKSIMSIKYGFNYYPKNNLIYHEVKNFTRSINTIDNCYLTNIELEIYFHHLIYIFNNQNQLTLTINEKEILSCIVMIPPKLENSLKNLINKLSKKKKQEILNYATLCFFFLNTHAFSPKITCDYKKVIYNLFIKAPVINDLINRIEEHLEINLKNNELALNILFNHIKLYCMNWNMFFSLDYLEDDDTEDFNSELLEIFLNWKNKYDLPLYFSPILVNHLYRKLLNTANIRKEPRLFIYTDSWIKYIEISNFLKENIPIKLSLIEYWTSSSSELISQCHPNDIVIFDNIEYFYSVNHEHIYYISSIQKENLTNLTEKIVKHLCSI
ncbi:hypothetical protein ACJXDE_12880 (plasmid) [Enterococcus faecium]|uniref:hypothetical protein n=1 Tax=Enterococcus faecium TaxID=1352 RepID=UPI0038D429FE